MDIYDTGSLKNAFGIYSSERSPEYDYVGAGPEVYRNEGVRNFFQGCEYVKIAWTSCD